MLDVILTKSRTHAPIPTPKLWSEDETTHVELRSMGKGRVRVRGAKGKRWRKGQSGSSNPSETRHRHAARGRFGDHLSRGRVPTSGPPLTADTLATHDATQEEGFALDRYSIERWRSSVARLGCVVVKLIVKSAT